MKSFSYYLTFALLLSFFGTSFQKYEAQRTNHRHDKEKKKMEKRTPVTTYPGEAIPKPPLKPKEGDPCDDGEMEFKDTKTGAWQFVGMAFISTGTDEDIDTFDIVKQIDIELNGNYNADLNPAIVYGQSMFREVLWCIFSLNETLLPPWKHGFVWMISGY